jgi:hypothetical protein
LSSTYELYSGPYISRNYILEDLTLPSFLLERGVRQFILDNMRGYPVSGSIQRCERDNQQYLLLQLVGTPENLLDIENNLLNSDQSYWTWYSFGTVFRDSLGNRQFKIRRNTQQAIKGTNSDPKNEYEYKSVSGSSRSTPSLPSKRSGGSGRSNRSV